jgi:hypothetical protein
MKKVDDTELSAFKSLKIVNFESTKLVEKEIYILL